jgi:hypothetical protein
MIRTSIDEMRAAGLTTQDMIWELVAMVSLPAAVTVLIMMAAAFDH